MLKTFIWSKLTASKYSLATVTLESFENWTFESGSKSPPSFFRWSLQKNTANGRDASQDYQMQIRLLSYLSNE